MTELATPVKVAVPCRYHFSSFKARKFSHGRDDCFYLMIKLSIKPAGGKNRSYKPGYPVAHA